MKFNPAAFAAWLAGFLAGYYSRDFLISILNGMVVTGVVYYVWMSIALSSGTTPEKQLKGGSEK